MLLMKKIEQS